MGILYRNNNDYVNKIDLTPFLGRQQVRLEGKRMAAVKPNLFNLQR
jgi:hypothetical protein